MTSSLRVVTGPEQVADHERRLRELERSLRLNQADLGKWRPGSPGGGPSVVTWNNTDGSVTGIYSEFNQQWVADGADTSWFEFPPSYAPTDLTRIFITAPGIWLVSLQVFYSAGTGEGTVEANSAPVCRADALRSGGGAFQFDQNQIDTAFPEVRVKVETANFTSAYLSLAYFAGEPAISTF